MFLEVIDDILEHCEDIHKRKVELINAQLSRLYDDGDGTMKEAIQNIKFTDSVIGLKTELSTHYRREQYFKQNYNFITPETIPIRKPGEVSSFYYYLPIHLTLGRQLNDVSLRKYIINFPIFSTIKVNIHLFPFDFFLCKINPLNFYFKTIVMSTW